MNGSHCATLDRSGSPPPVFNYSGGQATSDKVGNVASRRVPQNSDAVHTLAPPLRYRIIQVIRSETRNTRHSLKGALKTVAVGLLVRECAW